MSNKFKRFILVVLVLVAPVLSACNNPISDVILGKGGHNCPAEGWGGSCDN